MKSKWYHAKDQSRITNSSDQGRIRTLNLLNASPATLPTDQNLVLFSKMYLGPWQTTMMKLLVKIVTTLEANYFVLYTPQNESCQIKKVETAHFDFKNIVVGSLFLPYDPSRPDPGRIQKINLNFYFYNAIKLNSIQFSEIHGAKRFNNRTLNCTVYSFSCIFAN